MKVYKANGLFGLKSIPYTSGEWNTKLRKDDKFILLKEFKIFRGMYYLPIIHIGMNNGISYLCVSHYDDFMSSMVEEIR